MTDYEFDPTSAKVEFKLWQIEREKMWRREAHDESRMFVNAWAKVAWIAEDKRRLMGVELNKLQQRIGRQRKANRELQQRVHDLEAQLKVITKSLKDAYTRLYEDEDS